MKRKILAVSAAIAFCLSLAACGSETNTNVNPTTAAVTTAAASVSTVPSDYSATTPATTPATNPSATKPTSSQSSASSTQNNAGSNSSSSSKSSATAAPINELLDKYEPPAKAVDIAPEKSDPSNDKIKFEYDSSGRISKCYYDANNLDMYMAYSYTNNTVHILAFSGSVIVDDVTFEVEAYDKSVGMTEYKGYYFKGVKIKGA